MSDLLNELTDADVNMLMDAPESNRLPKGFAFKTVYDFCTSGDRYINLMSLPKLHDRKPASLKPTFERVLGEITSKYSHVPACKLGYTSDKLIIINVAAQRAYNAEQAAENEQ